VTLMGPRPSHTFLRPGVYTATVSVTDPANITGTDSVNVTITDGRVPTIVAVTPPSVDEDTDVVLDASGSTDNDPNFGVTGSFEWSYSSYYGPVAWRGANVTVRFPDPGTFTLKLSARDAAGNAAYRNFSIVVRDTTPPLANTGMDGATVLPGQEVVLLGTGSEDNDRRFPNAGTFVWTVSGPDGSTNYTGIRQALTFAYPGNFLVSLMVWDPSGNPAPAPSTMYIHVLDTVAPVPDGGGPRPVAVGDVVNFDGSGTTDNDPTILETGTFIWEFQDGAQRLRLEGLKQTYVFLAAGIYTVRLTVADAGDNRAAALFKVTVVDDLPPQIIAEPLPTQVESGTNVSVNASATTDNVGVLSIGWRVKGPFGYDHFVSGPEGSLQLTLPGDYNFTVTARDVAGNAATASFIVRAVPRASGGGNPGGEPNGSSPGTPGAGNGSGTGPVNPTTDDPSPFMALLPAATALLAAAAVVVSLYLWRRHR